MDGSSVEELLGTKPKYTTRTVTTKANPVFQGYCRRALGEAIVKSCAEAAIPSPNGVGDPHKRETLRVLTSVTDGLLGFSASQHT